MWDDYEFPEEVEKLTAVADTQRILLKQQGVIIGQDFSLKKKDLRVLIDDCRELGADITFRNPEAAIKALSRIPVNNVDCLLIDYCLNSNIDGLGVLKRLVDRIWGKLPKTIGIVSTHPQGVKYISEFLDMHGYNPDKEKYLWTKD